MALPRETRGHVDLAASKAEPLGARADGSWRRGVELEGSESEHVEPTAAEYGGTERRAFERKSSGTTVSSTLKGASAPPSQRPRVSGAYSYQADAGDSEPPGGLLGWNEPSLSESAPSPSESAPSPSESAPSPSESAPSPSESPPSPKVSGAHARAADPFSELDHLPLSLLLVERDGRLILANRRGRRLLDEGRVFSLDHQFVRTRDRAAELNFARYVEQCADAAGRGAEVEHTVDVMVGGQAVEVVIAASRRVGRRRPAALVIVRTL
jgi:hypothetical protein